jgi:uncharacterized DUF497 family protein
MRFHWDEKKSRQNLIKHKISFETATLVFEDPHSFSRFGRIEDGEQRWQTLGVAGVVACFWLRMSMTRKMAKR